MQDNIYNLFILISTAVTVFLGYLFDVPPPILWAAAIGSGFGVAFSKPTKPVFALGWVMTGVIFMGFGLPMLPELAKMHSSLAILNWPVGMQKGVAFFGTLLGIRFRHEIANGITGWVDNFFKRGNRSVGGRS